MTVQVGIIGVGAMGADHFERLTERVAGALVVAVADVDVARAQALAAASSDVRAYGDGQELIDDPDVQAVLVATWGRFHARDVVAALAVDKDVFCEKPMAESVEDCWRIVDAEIAHGRRRITVGFTRRFDSGYLAMKAELDAGSVGAPLMAHCVHRNATAPPYGFTEEQFMTDSAVHEIDICRWLFGQEMAAVRVMRPEPTTAGTPGLQDPQFLIMETVSGSVVDVEVFMNCGYAYDVRCELVAETGTLSLGEPTAVVVRQEGVRAGLISPGFLERFALAYDRELQEWVDGVAAGVAIEPTAWDGLAATMVSTACVESLRGAGRVEVDMPEKPEFYRSS
ncbi:MAG TPA: Gfo/Idh/MocA family oxidoreductase [Chloroflexota bacterium]|nr:Gfo/Idh/MocA family oxidoreductase [Chloroflexota bacterium]